MSQLSKNIFAFHVDLVFLELFTFTHWMFFGTPCRKLKVKVSMVDFNRCVTILEKQML